MALTKPQHRVRRHRRVRKKVMGTRRAPAPRRVPSNKHIYVQAIDDIAGHTLAAASTMENELRANATATTDAATRSASSSASASRPRGSNRWSSIAADSSTTAASRPSPTAPAPPD